MCNFNYNFSIIIRVCSVVSCHHLAGELLSYQSVEPIFMY